MAREIPQKLLYFLKNAIKDVDDGYEYASELSRILHSDDCQKALTAKEMERLREYGDKVQKIGEINYYAEEKIRDMEREYFGSRGILGFLGAGPEEKPQWPF
jgi:hypothetical protein